MHVLGVYRGKGVFEVHEKRKIFRDLDVDRPGRFPGQKGQNQQDRTRHDTTRRDTTRHDTTRRGTTRRELRIQGRMQIFEKISQKGLNHDLGPELETRGIMLQILLTIMDFGAFCVEL